VQKFSELMRGNELIVAPVALSPIMARLAGKEMKAAQTTCGLERLLEIERRTMKNH
jgi:hypothetical protein